MSKRLPSGEERELFESVLKDAKLLKGHARPRARPTVQKKPEERKPPLLASVRSAPPGPSGLDGRTAERLRRGQLEPQAKLDLHGLTEASAHRALLTFVKGAHTRGLRLLLIVTGKGAKEDSAVRFDPELAGRTRGVLKAMTPRWLKETDLNALVADVRTAHRRHGGTGALYVYLRKRLP